MDLFATLQGAALPADASLALLEQAIDRDRPHPALTPAPTPAPTDPVARYSRTAPARTAAD